MTASLPDHSPEKPSPLKDMNDKDMKGGSSMFRRRNLAAAAVLVLVVAFAAVTGASAQRQANPIVIEVIAPVATPIENYPEALAGARAATGGHQQARRDQGPADEVKFEHALERQQAMACARQAVADGATVVTGHPARSRP